MFFDPTAYIAAGMGVSCRRLKHVSRFTPFFDGEYEHTSLSAAGFHTFEHLVKVSDVDQHICRHEQVILDAARSTIIMDVSQRQPIVDACGCSDFKAMRRQAAAFCNIRLLVEVFIDSFDPSFT